jgi:hypothetical protein
MTRSTNNQSSGIRRESDRPSQFIISSISDDCQTLLLPA